MFVVVPGVGDIELYGFSICYDNNCRISVNTFITIVCELIFYIV